MNRRLLLRRSLAFHRRNHLGVALGAAVAAAVLVGALAVGDSVRATLRRRALDRIGGFEAVLDGHDRFFRARPGGPAGTGAGTNGTFALKLPAVASRQDGTARANAVTLLGTPPDFWRYAPAPHARGPVGEEVLLNEALARQLSAKPGDEVVLRIHKPSALSQDAVITPRDGASVALRARVGRILSAAEFGDFSLAADGAPPFNAYVPHERLAMAAGLPGRANLAALDAATPADAASLSRAVRAGFDTMDAELEFRPPAGGKGVELVSRRIFIDPAVLSAALALTNPVPPAPILTYLANAVGHAGRLAPYSMVAAADAPYTPPGMAEDEILVNDWLAEDLGVGPGDPVSVTYYRVDSGARLAEHTNTFRVRAVVPMAGPHADRTLMPDFPGLAKAESTRDWDAGFDLVHTIRAKDEAYWKRWRGVPKAFVTAAAGRRMWSSRFGDATAVRWPSEAARPEELRAAVRAALDPEAVGLRFEAVRGAATRAAGGGQDFGGLFVGFSFFLIASAALLTALLFRFGIERRAGEIGALLALGWTPGRAGRLLLREGLAVAALGAAAGAAGGMLYGGAVIRGLNTLWSDAVAGTRLQFSATPASLAGGMMGAVLVAGIAQWLTLRGVMRRPARALLGDGAEEAAPADARPGVPRVAYGCLALAATAAAAGAKLDAAERPGAFFGAGFLVLVGGLLMARRRMRLRDSKAMDFAAVARRAPARRPGRSTSVVALLAIAVFLIVAVAANRLDAARDGRTRASGTGGFALWAESSLPVVEDLATDRGRERLGLDPRKLAGVSFVPLRVRAGDDASCLNLNRAGRPGLLGVDPALLDGRGAFLFATRADGVPVRSPWAALERGAFHPASGPPLAEDEVAAIGDANSIRWALGRRVGDTLDYVDGRGRPFRVRLVGAVANSILQGRLLIAESEFTRRFPDEAGHRAFLVDAPADAAPAAAELTRGLADLGFETTPAMERLNRFNAVQNTYLGTFQVLGGLGLLLGSFGLGLVVLRNVHERRAELGVLRAVGWSSGRIESLVLREHVALLRTGVLLGTGASLVAAVPALVSPGGGLPWATLGAILAGVVLNGLLWTWLATRAACRGGLVAALRGE